MKKVFQKITVLLCAVMLLTVTGNYATLKVQAVEPAPAAAVPVTAAPVVNPASPNMGITLEQVLAYNQVSNILPVCPNIYLSTATAYIGPDNPAANLPSGTVIRNSKIHFTTKDGSLHAECYSQDSCEVATKVTGRPDGAYITVLDKNIIPFAYSFVAFYSPCYDKIVRETYQRWGTDVAQFHETLSSVTAENGFIVVRSVSDKGAHTYYLDPQTMLITYYECHNSVYQENVAVSYNVPPADGFQMPVDPVAAITGSQNNCLVTAVVLPGTPQQEVHQYTVPKNCISLYAFTADNFYTTFSDPECKNWIVPNTSGDSTAFYVKQGSKKDVVVQMLNSALSALQ